MSQSWVRALMVQRRIGGFGLVSGRSLSPHNLTSNLITPISNNRHLSHFSGSTPQSALGSPFSPAISHGIQTVRLGLRCCRVISIWSPLSVNLDRGFCTINGDELEDILLSDDAKQLEESSSTSVGDSATTNIGNNDVGIDVDFTTKKVYKKPVDFTTIDLNLLPTVIIIGRPNVGKSALFNRLIRRREALVYNTPEGHVTRDIREGIAKLSDLRFRVLDSAGLETEASSGSILDRTSGMTANVLSRSQFAIFLIDARIGLHPLDLEVGKWLRKHAPEIKPIIAMNKSESLFDGNGSLELAAAEVHKLGFGDAIAISAETGLGMPELYQYLRPLLEDYQLEVLNGNPCNGRYEENLSDKVEKSKLPLQLAIVGRPNVGKSTLLNTLLQEDRVLVGPEAGLTRDSVRAQFKFQERTIFLVDTAGWLHRTKQEKGPASLSIVQSRKSLLRSHIVALILDAEEIVNARRSLKHSEVVIARRAVEEGRGLVVVVNKMDTLRGKQSSSLYAKVMEIVPQEIQTTIPQVTGIPVVFISALEGKGRIAMLHQVIDTYEKWCSRLPTARLNRWLLKVMSRHSWKDQAAQPKVKYFTQVKARPPTFVAFVSGKTPLSDTDIRFLTKSLKEDFDLGGIPIRIMQRYVTRKGTESCSKSSQSASRKTGKIFSDKRTTTVEQCSLD